MLLRTLTGLTIIISLLAAATPAPAQLTELTSMREDFNWTAANPICKTLGGVGNREIVHQSPSTGFHWGGYNAQTTGADAGRSISTVSSGGALAFERTSASEAANKVGSYVYTIFATGGGGTPNRYVDLSGPGATFKITSNNTAGDQAVQWLIRDRNGNWYLSNQQTWTARIPAGIQEPANIQAFPVGLYTWQSLNSTDDAEMDQMDNNGESPLDGLVPGTPDLTQVTGAGIYVSRSNLSDQFKIDWFQLAKDERLFPTWADYSTHALNIRNNVTLGLTEFAGGYGGQFFINSATNICCPGFGRGFGWAFRDRLHGAVYNPTQAGYEDAYGDPANLTMSTSSVGTDDRIDVSPFRVSLWNGDNIYDFCQFDDLTKGAPYGAGNGDADRLSESGYTQKDEVESEWEASGFYEDVSSIISDTDVSAIRSSWNIAYKYSHHALDQFVDPAAVRTDLVNVYRPSEYATPDISDLLDGAQASGQYDMSDMPCEIWTDRFDRNTTNYNYFWWIDPQTDDWTSAYMDTLNSWKVATGTDGYRLTLIATHATDINCSAIGLYYPAWSRLNQYPIAGIVSSTGQILYVENRNQYSTSQAAYRSNGTYWTVNEKQLSNNFNKRYLLLNMRGMLAPNSYINGTYEALRSEFFIIVGKPSEIRAAAADIDAYFTTHQPAPGKGSLPTPSNNGTGAYINAPLTWWGGDNATAHEVYFGTSYASVDTATTASAEYKGSYSTTTYTPTTLSKNTTYYWRVDSVGSTGRTKGWIWAFTTYNGATNVPTGAPSELFVTTAKYNQVNLAWVDNSSEDGFRIERSKNGEAFKVVGTAAAATDVQTFTDNAVTPSTQYAYRVCAYNACGITGYSNTFTFTTPPQYIDYQFEAAGNQEGWVAKNMTSVTVSGGNLTGTSSTGDPYFYHKCLLFSGSDNSTLYFRMKTNSTNAMRIFWMTEADTAYSYVDLGGINGDTNYHDYSIDMSGQSNWMGKKIKEIRLDPTAQFPKDIGFAYIQGFNPATVPPAAPTGLTASVVAGLKIRLNWTDNASNETGYSIQRSTNGGAFTEIATVGAGVTTYDDGALGSNKRYIYRVGVKNAGGVVAYSNLIACTSPTCISYQWNGSDAEGWVAQHDMTTLSVSSGSASSTTTNTDPYMQRASVSFAGDNNPVMYIRCKTTSASSWRLYWTNTGSGTYYSVSFNVTADGNFHDYTIDMTGQTEWMSKTINLLRLDPGWGETAQIPIAIDYLQGYNPLN